MARRPVPDSLAWLIGLSLLSVATAVIGGGVLYGEARHRARGRAEAATGGSAAAGAEAIGRHGCGACHVIPGIAGAVGTVGPDLTAVGKRAMLAGSLANEPEGMIRWLRHPQALRPGSGMPEMGVGEREARDIAAYLYAAG
jgi:cytochrome c